MKMLHKHFTCLLLTPKTKTKEIKPFFHQSQTYTIYMYFPFSKLQNVQELDNKKPALRATPSK